MPESLATARNRGAPASASAPSLCSRSSTSSFNRGGPVLGGRGNPKGVSLWEWTLLVVEVLSHLV